MGLLCVGIGFGQRGEAHRQLGDPRISRRGAAQGQQQFPPSSIPILDGQVIPLTNAPNQQLQVTLQINGGTLTLNLIVSWNQVGLFWVMQILDQNFNALLSDIPLLTGFWPAANILEPFDYMGIGGATVINQGGDGDWPDVNGWGTGSYILIWYSNQAFA